MRSRSVRKGESKIMDERLREVLIRNQYKLPVRLQEYAGHFPNVSYFQAVELYALSVREVLVLYKAKHLYDEPLSFGRGIVYARKFWLEKMNRANEMWDNYRGNVAELS